MKRMTLEAPAKKTRHATIAQRCDQIDLRRDASLTLLPSRGDSERSWTVEIAARRRTARTEAEKVRNTAHPDRKAIASLNERITAARKAAKRNNKAIARFEDER
ncbi:MAG: hypothetical protein ACREH8_06215, partial [Opitutaceae bacterium]